MTLAWPAIVEQVTQTAVQYIDTAMVGSLGTQATAAVGATSTIAWLVGSTFSGGREKSGGSDLPGGSGCGYLRHHCLYRRQRHGPRMDAG